jgi:hypothetical protein
MRVKSGRIGFSKSWGAGGLLAVAALLLATGCTREFFRDRADADVDRLLAKRTEDERWPLINYWIYPHPLSRFADFDSPDCPAMPPDDPAAWFLSHKPQHPSKVGFHEGTGYLEMLAQFDAITRGKEAQEAKHTTQTQAPAIAPQESSERRPYLIDLGQALELAVINSRELQARREDLYLAALPVSFEQFNFLPQFLATQEAIRQWSARESAFGHTDEWQLNSAVGVSQNFATGAALLLRLANQTIVDLSSFNKPTLSQSTLVLDVTQPLLRGGGRAVALEPLTQTERDLLYEVRDYARFNKLFFTTLAGGGPGNQLVPGSGSILFGGGIRAPASATGFLPVVTQKLVLEIQRRNVVDFERLLQFYREFAEGGGVSQLQVDQVEQQALVARTRVLQQQVNYQNDLDLFKIELGLPTDTPLDLDPGDFREVRTQIFRFQQLENEYHDFSVQLLKLMDREDGTGSLRRIVLELVQTSNLTRGTEFARTFPQRLERWRRLNSGRLEVMNVVGTAAALANILPGGAGFVVVPKVAQAATWAIHRQRQLLLHLINQRDALIDNEQEVPPELEDRIRRERYEYELGWVDFLLTTYQGRPWLKERDERIRKAEQESLYRQIETRMALVADEARREREVKYTQQWPKLPPAFLGDVDLVRAELEMAQNLAGQSALANRLDLMNQQAQLVDSWRKVAVFANSLLGTFDVRYNATVLTPPPVVAQPLNFDGNNARHQLIFNTELPLVRRLERNNYRASLIAYQRQRRNLQAVQDQILFQVRSRVRRLQQLQETYRIQQRGLLLAYSSVNNALETLQAPPEPGATRDTASTAASLTQQLINAQQRLPNAQSELYQTWLNYLVARMELYRDLELMQIDSRGVWIDDSAQSRPTSPAP